MTEIDTTEPLTLHQEMEVHETTSDEKVIQLEAEVAKLKDEWLRALAEVENVRRRAQKEKEEAARYGAVSFARDILSVTDNLRRALESCPQDGITDSMKALITGIEMT